MLAKMLGKDKEKAANDQEKPAENDESLVSPVSVTVNGDGGKRKARATPGDGMRSRQFSLGMLNYAIQDLDELTPPDTPTETPRPAKLGSYRYLRGVDVEDSSYDFAIVMHQQEKKEGSESPEKDGFQASLLERLIENGLDVGILEGDFSSMAKGEGSKSEYYILLVRGSDDVLARYAHKLKYQMWLRSGSVHDVDNVVKGDLATMSPADRNQVLDHIIREGAHIHASDPSVTSIFPVHDEHVNEEFLHKYFQSLKLERVSTNFLDAMTEHFGSKVSYYFAYMDCYNKSLVPIALIGLLLAIFRAKMGMAVYMRLLVVWAFLVSVVWSFWFLKTWTRRNSELNFRWENNLETKEFKYRNPEFKGEEIINPITGRADQYYPSWKRLPKYLVAGVFMIGQIFIMMLLIAVWITAFEVIQVRWPESGFLTVQWCYIALGGVAYGLFVDVFQWTVVVSRAARVFTDWENWKTIEQYERSLIRKLFIMDFLNYYTWFFLLAFVYVIPGVGDLLTNMLNSLIWKDPPNCCFGPYMDAAGIRCRACPKSWIPIPYASNRCVACKGWVTFDINHLDIETLFVTPIVITQGLNLLIAVTIPWINRRQHEHRLKKADQKVMEIVKKQGPRQILADMEYREEDARLKNLSKARFLENDDGEMEKLNAKAHDIIFQSEQDDYDPYDDYHHAVVQFGYVVMFSMLWPPMPLACMVINALKMRGDGFRLCRSLKRPFPRKAGGIGEWYKLLTVMACIGIVVNIGLVFVSTGAMEFYSEDCTTEITQAMGGDFSTFHFGPDFSCYSLTTRMVMILVAEHIIFIGVWMFWRIRHSVPAQVQVEMLKREFDFKERVYRSKSALDGKPDPQRSVSDSIATGTGRTESLLFSQNARKSTPSARLSRSLPASASPGGSGSKRESTTKGEREPLLSSKLLAQAWDESKAPGSSNTFV